jgi:uncharacterized membrane protein (TIGR01666 family)
MDYIKEYKSFINSHYFNEGVRITAGIVLPAIIFNHFNLLSVGVVVSLGAMTTSIPDTPGPILHRKNGMLAGILINTLIAILTGFAAPFPLLLTVLILMACFIFSMIGVYGARANSVGVAALLIMVLNMGRHHEGWDVVINAGYILAGGLWYMLLSLLLYSFRPYKLAQQALGDCIIATADYLRIRSSFYEKEVDYEATYQRMLAQQSAVHEQQKLVRELLFKDRNIIKESTITGRVLLMIFTDMVDLFERTMNAYHDYKDLHEVINDAEIFEQYRLLIIELSNELDEIGIAVKSGRASAETGLLAMHISKTTAFFEAFRDTHRTAENLNEFISMRHILNSIGDIASRIHTLHLYSTYDKELPSKTVLPSDYDKFISHQPIDVKLLLDNLTLESNTFRHALRISIATLIGFIISLLFPVGHSYWILLTIIVILKPAYSLTKKRNYQRLAGTVLGAFIGLLILYFIKDKEVLFVMMLLMMVGTYSLMRINYMISVIFMTPYILLLFHLLSNASFETIIQDRITDTAIGFGIAFVANLLLLPAWELEKIGKSMQQAINSNKLYFKDVAGAFTGNPVTNLIYKISRKNAFVELANLSDAYNRMLAEPKSKQKNMQQLYQFVVLNHMLTAHIATLASYVMPLSEKFASQDFAPLINNAVHKLDNAANIIADVPGEILIPDKFQNTIQQRLQQLLQTRRTELQQGILESATKRQLSEFKPIADQFNFIGNIAGDIEKIGGKWVS